MCKLRKSYNRVFFGVFMIRFRLKERMADLTFRRGTRVTIDELAAATGLSAITISRVANRRGYNCTTDVLDKLCAFFECKLDELAEYIPDDQVD